MIPGPVKRVLRRSTVDHPVVDRLVTRLFFERLVRKTNNFANCTWFGHRIWQNPLDLWTIQEAINEVRPGLLIESGTNRGGSALFFAGLFDLMGTGEILTIDIERMHDIVHPRIEFLVGSSVAEATMGRVRARVAAARGPVMVILDSDHSEPHVSKEMELYGPLVTPGSFMLVQDGVSDLPGGGGDRPGPLVAIKRFLTTNLEFEVDHERCDRFLITHHPLGWLRRKVAARPKG
jgi:cephalosporin hydroxylase